MLKRAKNQVFLSRGGHASNVVGEGSELRRQQRRSAGAIAIALGMG